MNLAVRRCPECGEPMRLLARVLTPIWQCSSCGEAIVVDCSTSTRTGG